MTDRVIDVIDVIDIIHPVSSSPSSILLFFLFATLFIFRVTHFITADTFPPMARLRSIFLDHIRPPYDDLIICPWCVSLWLSILLYLPLCHLIDIPLPVFQAAASSALTGMLSEWEGKT